MRKSTAALLAMAIVSGLGAGPARVFAEIPAASIERSGRQNKGAKKRAASARRAKGWA